MPDLAATLTTQAEQEAEDDNLSFLRSEIPDDDDSSTYDDANESRRRMRRAVNAMVEPRVYTPQQLQELGDLQEPTYADRLSRQEYHGWAPGTDDDDEDIRHDPRIPSQSSAALLDEHVLRRDEHLRDRMRLRRLRDATQLEWRDLVPSDPDVRDGSSQERSHFIENGIGGAPTATESSLRTTALLQAVRRNPQISARSRNELQRYILDRERIGHGSEDRERATSTRSHEPMISTLSPSQRRQMHREATVRQEIQQHRDLLAEHQQHRHYLEEQLRQQRHGLVPPSDNRRRRYWHTPSPCPPSSKRSIDEAIKYLERLRLCESDQEARETAEDGGFRPEEGCPEDHQDFLVDTTSIAPPPESSWLKVGGVLSGTQHAAAGCPLPSYTPLMPPSTYRARTRNPHFGSVPPRTTSPISMPSGPPLGMLPHIPASSNERSQGLDEERWPVKLTIHGVDYRTMTLSGIMEAFDVPDKSSPTKVSSITTFLEGEIIDFNKFTLETRSFTAGTRVDGIYWRKLPPFDDMSDDEAMVKNLLSKDWLKKELMEKFILMRWKGLPFTSTPQIPKDCSLTLNREMLRYPANPIRSHHQRLLLHFLAERRWACRGLVLRPWLHAISALVPRPRKKDISSVYVPVACVVCMV